MVTSAIPPVKRKVTSTVVTETLPGNSNFDARPEEFYDGDPWEVIARIHREIEKKIPWEHHMARIYRVNEKGDSESVPENNKFTEPFDVDSLRERFGGGRFKVWIYGPPERSKLVVRPFIVTLDGASKIETSSFRSMGAAPAGENAVALEAMRMYANPQFMQMQMDLMRQGMLMVIETVKQQMPQAQDPLATLRNAKEILGPGPSQDNGLIAHITLLKELGLLGSPEKKGITEVLETLNAFKTAGLIPSAVQKVDLMSTFANNLPMIVDRFVNGLHEFRLQAESQERAVRLSQGQMRANDPNVITLEGNSPAPAQSPSAPTQPAPPSTNAATLVTPEIAQAIIVQSHLHRIVMGIKQPNATGEDLFDYLNNAWPEILPELSKMSKETLLAFFQSRELQIQYWGFDILAEVGNDPRLPKMIEDFLRIAKENSQAETVASSAAVV
jgi:hypothetical protein